MAIYFHWAGASPEVWNNAFKLAGAGTDIRVEGAIGDADDIEFAVVWAPPPGKLRTFPNLRYIFSIGAGVSHITRDSEAPLHVPIVRLLDDNLVLDMSCHVVHWVLHFHRHYHRYRHYQTRRKWLRHRYPENRDRRVVVLGLGQTGQEVCRHLGNLGFKLHGWSRTPKRLDGVECVHGDPELPGILRHADILVNLLPLTSATEDLINAVTFDLLPDGAFLINCGRGGTVTDADLIAALDSGKIEAAALDVFRDEPLPETHPFWDHPKVAVTPHAAAPTNETSAASFIAGQIKLALGGARPAPIVDMELGY